MQVKITSQPTFRFPLSAKEAEMLKILAAAHYDYTCRQTAQVGGFIYGWNNMMYKFGPDDVELEMGPDDTAEVSGTWRDLDLACKILEPSNYIGFEPMMPCGMRLYAHFRKLLQMYNDTYYPMWQATVEI